MIGLKTENAGKKSLALQTRIRCKIEVKKEVMGCTVGWEKFSGLI
jgi:hypothetical protein